MGSGASTSFNNGDNNINNSNGIDTNSSISRQSFIKKYPSLKCSRGNSKSVLISNPSAKTYGEMILMSKDFEQPLIDGQEQQEQNQNHEVDLVISNIKNSTQSHKNFDENNTFNCQLDKKLNDLLVLNNFFYDNHNQNDYTNENKSERVFDINTQISDI